MATNSSKEYVPTQLTTEVAAVLRGILGREQIRQSTVAEVTGISQSHISKLLRGLKRIDIDALDNIARLIGVEASAIIATAEHNIQQQQANVTPLRRTASKAFTAEERTEYEAGRYAASNDETINQIDPDLL